MINLSRRNDETNSQATIVLAHGSPCEGAAQNLKPTLSVGIISQSIGLPSIPQFSSLKPGLQLSLQTPYGKRSSSGWFHKTSVTAVVHRGWGNWVMFSSGLGFHKRLSNFFVAVNGGPGYMACKSELKNYRYDSGRYVSASGIDHRLLLTTAGLAGYDMGKFKLLISYEIFIEAPFMKGYSVLLPHQLIGVGLATPLR